MLLKKKIILISVLLILLLSASSYAQVCEVGKIKQALRKALYLHFINEGSGLTPNEVKDMLVFYLTISAQNSTVDCSALGLNSNKPIFDVLIQGENLLDRIPACADGTKYGECSKLRPSYCYAGAIYEKCGLCGCPTNSVCGKSGKCETLSQNVTCFRDIDCGQSEFVGEYFCWNRDYIARNYINYTCVNPGTTSSGCVKTNSTTVLNYCSPSLNQVCVSGQSICKLTINDSAPTVAISVAPTNVPKGQFFNVTVTGTDDVGLAAIWWWGVSTSDTELNKAHWFSCNGAKVCKNSWLVSTNATDILTLGANSRDTAYPVAGQPHQASEGAGIAYATITVTDPGTAAVSGLTIKGRLIDKFTLKPVANVAIFLGTSTTGQALNPIYTNANGEFAVTTNTNITSAKMFPYWPKCYQQGFFLLEKKFDGSLNVRLYLFDLVREDKSFAVTGSEVKEVNLGDVPLWPSVDIAVNSDVAVQMNIEFPEEGRGYGNINYKTSHYLSNIMPLAYNARVQLKDQLGNAYYSPYKTYGLENGCAPVTLAFSSKQFAWSGAQTNLSNASNCFVKIDGVVVKSVYATDRNDCYSKTSFGSINCKTYAPYFTDGVRFLEQYFGANDRVNNEYCTCTNGVCVQGNQTAQNVTLHSLAVNGSNLEAVYSKNFDTCVHLLTSTSTITHTQNYFCTQGSYIKTTVPLSGFNVAVGQNYKLCHGNNYNVCSALTTLVNVSADVCVDYDNGDNIFVASYAKKGTQAQYDKCGSAGQNYDIIEGVCTNGQLSGIPHSCPAGTKCQNIRYEPAVYANVSACVNVTTTNQTALSPTGVCLVRDAYTSVPIFSAPDLGKGYAKAAKPGVNTISGLQSACSLTDFDNLLKTYCTQNPNPIQEQVMTYDSNGNWQSLSCGAYGCNFKNCTTTANQTTSCTDSDGGQDIYLKGTTAYKACPTCYNDSITDFCSNNYVTEGWCGYDPAINGIGRYQASYLCANGCLDGACIGQTPANQTNVSFKCTDSDNGLSYYIYGTTNGYRAYGIRNSSNIVTEKDSCTTVCSGSVGSGIGSTGQCLLEYYCDSLDYAAFNVYTCPYGCQNGACVNQTSQTTSNQSIFSPNSMASGSISGMSVLNYGYPIENGTYLIIDKGMDKNYAYGARRAQLNLGTGQYTTTALDYAFANNSSRTWYYGKYGTGAQPSHLSIAIFYLPPSRSLDKALDVSVAADSGTKTVYFPAIASCPYTNHARYFYIGTGGSTYFARADHLCGYADLSPEEAIVSQHLARAAS
ncbi:hypothetical protein HYT92_02435 [Candidatus Pacearchaeota archaeon]|nr:hypothetical protein [Candidatus Pacearchaeota archaeon]